VRRVQPWPWCAAALSSVAVHRELEHLREADVVARRVAKRGVDAVGLDRGRWPSLLPDLLPDRPGRAPTRGYGEAPRGPEGAAQRHKPTPGTMDLRVSRITHNPKVAGSNPAPATKKTQAGALLGRGLLGFGSPEVAICQRFVSGPSCASSVDAGQCDSGFLPDSPRTRLRYLGDTDSGTCLTHGCSMGSTGWPLSSSSLWVVPRPRTRRRPSRARGVGIGGAAPQGGDGGP
jgi:hypothetical protein